MKKYFILTLILSSLLMLTQTSQAEARGHYSRTSMHVNVGSRCDNRGAYVVRHYAHPAPVVYVHPAYYYPQVYAAPAYVAPAYVEEVYVAPSPRPFSFAGLSLSWNFFK